MGSETQKSDGLGPDFGGLKVNKSPMRETRNDRLENHYFEWEIRLHSWFSIVM